MPVLLLLLFIPIHVFAGETRDVFATRVAQESSLISQRLSKAQRLSSLAAAASELNGAAKRALVISNGSTESPLAQYLSLLLIERKQKDLSAALKMERAPAEKLGLKNDFKVDQIIDHLQGLGRQLHLSANQRINEFGNSLFGSTLDALRTSQALLSSTGMPHVKLRSLEVHRYRKDLREAVAARDLDAAIRAISGTQNLLKETTVILDSCGIRNMALSEKIAQAQKDMADNPFVLAKIIRNSCSRPAFNRDSARLCSGLKRESRDAVLIAQMFDRVGVFK